MTHLLLGLGLIGAALWIATHRDAVERFGDWVEDLPAHQAQRRADRARRTARPTCSVVGCEGHPTVLVLDPADAARLVCRDCSDYLVSAAGWTR